MIRKLIIKYPEIPAAIINIRLKMRENYKNISLKIKKIGNNNEYNIQKIIYYSNQKLDKKKIEQKSKYSKLLSKLKNDEENNYIEIHFKYNGEKNIIKISNKDTHLLHFTKITELLDFFVNKGKKEIIYAILNDNENYEKIMKKYVYNLHNEKFNKKYINLGENDKIEYMLNDGNTYYL